MPDQDRVAEFNRSRQQWEVLGQDLARQAEQLALDTVAEALPGAAVVELRGEFNEDWLRLLRIRRVRSTTGDVLFDVTEGPDDWRVEDAIDEVNYEFLDLIIDLTGDRYMGNTTIELELQSS
jgi:hypothetical protein